MNLRFARGGSIAIALGLVLTGGAALAAGTSPAALKWKEGKTFPSTATRFDGALVGTKVYFLGWRVDDAGTTDGSVVYYDTKKDKYVDTKTDMPTPISNYQIAVLKDKNGVGLYVFGGRDANGAIIKDVQVYYPKTNKAVELSKKDAWPGKTPSKCVSLPGSGVAVVKNTAYVLGGSSFSTSVPPCTDDNSNQVWAFNPTAQTGKKWKAMPKLNVARGYISAAVVGSTIYAVGGDVNDAGTLTASSTVESWKVGAKSWNDKGVKDLLEPCDESQAFGLAKTVVLAGCGQWPNALADVQVYTIKKDKWAQDTPLNEARRNQAGENLGSAKSPNLMIVGGYNSDGSVILDTSEFGTSGKFVARPGASTGHVSTSAGKVSLF
jgi:N-acetylneuraminic acid mutarotase